MADYTAGYPPLWTEETLHKIMADMARSYFEKHHSRQHMVLIASVDIECTLPKKKKRRE